MAGKTLVSQVRFLSAQRTRVDSPAHLKSYAEAKSGLPEGVELGHGKTTIPSAPSSDRRARATETRKPALRTTRLLWRCIIKRRAAKTARLHSSIFSQRNKITRSFSDRM